MITVGGTLYWLERGSGGGGGWGGEGVCARVMLAIIIFYNKVLMRFIFDKCRFISCFRAYLF